MENEKIKNLFTGRQLDDKKWTSEMASTDEDMGGYFFLQLFTVQNISFYNHKQKGITYIYGVK